MSDETLTCATCGATIAREGEIVPPDGWMRFEEGWICSAHDHGIAPIMSELATICETLERGDLPLEESLALYERGVWLNTEAKRRLDAAEARVEVMSADGVIRPFR